MISASVGPLDSFETPVTFIRGLESVANWSRPLFYQLFPLSNNSFHLAVFLWRVLDYFAHYIVFV